MRFGHFVPFLKTFFPPTHTPHNFLAHTLTRKCWEALSSGSSLLWVDESSNPENQYWNFMIPYAFMKNLEYSPVEFPNYIYIARVLLLCYRYWQVSWYRIWKVLALICSSSRRHGFWRSTRTFYQSLWAGRSDILTLTVIISYLFWGISSLLLTVRCLSNV